MSKQEILGNLTTIIKILIMTLGPSIAVYLNVKPDAVITFLTACLTFGLAVLDAKYPNTLFVNQTIDTDDGILNDEYTLQSLGGEEDEC